MCSPVNASGCLPVVFVMQSAEDRASCEPNAAWWSLRAGKRTGLPESQRLVRPEPSVVSNELGEDGAEVTLA